MANDTKDIVLAILKYLDDSMDDERVDSNKISSEALNISEPKFSRILSMMLEEGYITGYSSFGITGVTYDGHKAIDPRITFQGLDYLEENKPSAKVYAILKEIKEWIPGI